jgi:hypothetical protein
MDFVFKLNEQDAQTILNVLVKEPYIEVVELISKIQQQAFEQKNDSEEVQQ